MHFHSTPTNTIFIQRQYLFDFNHQIYFMQQKYLFHFNHAVTDDMILLKGYFELRTGQSENEIRESITEVLK